MASVSLDIILREMGLIRWNGSERPRPCRNIQAQTKNILKKVICQAKETRSFVEVSKIANKTVKSPIITSDGHSRYEDGKLFIKNTSNGTYDCIALRDSGSSHRLLYSLPIKPKWEDHMSWTGPLDASQKPPLKNFSHKPSLFILRDNNNLYRHNLCTGELYESFFLGADVRFKEMICDMETKCIIIKSRKNKVIPNVVVSFLLFKYPPLVFFAHMQITKSAFGKDVVDAAIFQGLLLVMRQSKKTISIYSLEDILDNCIASKQVVDVHAKGFPVNVHITDEPKCLFRTTSHNYYLQFGSMPWKFVTLDSNFHLHVYDLKSEEIVKNNHCLLPSKDENYYDRLLFQQDDSPRLIQVSADKLRIFRFNRDQEDSECMEELFSIRAHVPNPSEPLPPPGQIPVSLLFSRPSRRSVPTSSVDLDPFQDLDILTNSDNRIRLICEYEDELEVIAILALLEMYSQDDETDDVPRIRLEALTLIDSNSYDVLREIDINREVRFGQSLSYLLEHFPDLSTSHKSKTVRGSKTRKPILKSIFDSQKLPTRTSSCQFIYKTGDKIMNKYQNF